MSEAKIVPGDDGQKLAKELCLCIKEEDSLFGELKAVLIVERANFF